MNPPLCLTKLLLVIISVVYASYGLEIEVSASDDLGQALQDLTSNTALYLLPGHYEINEFIKIKDLVNVTISGTSTRNATIITCSNDLGLAFLNITGLRITNISVSGCGFFSEKHLGDIRKEITATTDIFHKISNNVKIGIIFGNIRDLELEEVQVAKSAIGIIAINILGNSSFTSLDIVDNYPSICYTDGIDITYIDASGGGLFILYTDRKEYDSNANEFNDINDADLVIKNSRFMNNTNCNALSGTPIVYQDSQTARDFGYVVSGSGGLSIVLAQFTYTVSVSVTESVFIHNNGLYGGATSIQHFKGSSGGYVSFSNCLFDKNNVDRVATFRSVGSAGMMVFNAPVPEEIAESAMFDGRDIQELSSNIVNFDNCQIKNNNGTFAAGFYVYSLYSELTSFENANQLQFSNCDFLNNSISLNVGLISVFERKFSSFEPGLQLYLHSLTVDGNSGIPQSSESSSSGIYNSLILLQSVNTTLSGTCLFTNNHGSSILAITSFLYISGNISFIDNMATVGGALQMLTSSGIVISNHSNLLFKGNSAAASGGAIYVYLPNVANDVGNIADCFLWFDSVDQICQYHKCVSPALLDFNVSFIDNSAPLGSTVYGSALQSCSWRAAFGANPLDNNNHESGFEILQSFTEGKFVIKPAEFTESNEENRVINTPTSRLDVEYLDTDQMVLTSQPGRVIQFKASAYDSLNQSVPLVITSQATYNDTEIQYANIESQLGLSGYWFLSGEQEPETLSMVVYGNYTNNNVSVTLYSLSSSARTQVQVELEDCRYGSILTENDQSKMVCSCSPEINTSLIICSENTNSLTISANYWIGETSAGIYSIHSCIFDYCSEGERTVDSPFDDNQCSDNRRGILCGNCSEDYSAVFGSSECLECNNYNLFWQVLLFLIMGVVLIAVIGFLDFTVGTGYINGIIFFANIAGFLIPTYAAEYPASRVLFLVISLVNFDTGIPVCVYHGMTALARSGLSLLFPFYLFFLMGVLIIAARRFPRLSTAFSASRTFATLLILCYSTIFKICVEVFGLVRIRTLAGDHVYIGWRVDPNVEYGKHDGHIVLITIAVLLLIFYIAPFTLILLSPPHILSKTKCGEKIRIKFHPLFDAFWNPFKNNLCFWPGLRCLLRLAPYVIFSTTAYPESAFSITLFTAILMLVQVYVEPYKKSILNKLEIALLFILMFLSIGTIYFPQETSADDILLPALYVVIVTLVLYAIFCAFFLLHIRDRFPEKWNNSVEHLKSFLKKICCCCCNKKTNEEIEDTDVDAKISIAAQIASKRDVPTKDVVRLRESLLEHVVETSII